jgi:dihydrodipicolinate synthase/N-acetylneuraminate lyase
LANPISRLTSALFRETSPVPLKYALGLLGLMSPRVRLPLVESTEQTKAELAVIIAQMRDEHREYVIANARGPVQRGYRAVAG